VEIDGARRSIFELLEHPALSRLLSFEGTIRVPTALLPEEPPSDPSATIARR
jgi:hypothetical protein